MKSSLVTFVLFLFAHLPLAMSQEVPKEISVDNLNHVNVVGRIGVHLGKAVVIDVVVAANDQSGTKEASGHYFLKVKTVDGVPLKGNIFMPFVVRGSKVDDDDPFASAGFSLPTDAFELYRLKNGRKAKELSSKDISELEKGFIGKEYKLLVYETGGYSGLPNSLPKHYPVWQDHGFAFTTYLMILGEQK